MTVNDFGRIILVEECQRIEMKSVLIAARNQIKQSLLLSVFEADGLKTRMMISKTGNGGERYWFACPQCSARCAVMFRHPNSRLFGCRLCLNLRYRKSAQKGMPETTLTHS